MRSKIDCINIYESKNGEPEIGNKIVIPFKDIQNNVKGHPDANVDVALLECTGIFVLMMEKMYVKFVPYEMLANFKESELSVAENVYFIGYPDNRYDAKNNLPLVRTGMISSHPKYDYNGDPVFIIDAQVFPGSSGSPVYIDLTYENFKNGQIVVGGHNIKLLGIVSATMIRNNQLKAITTATNIVAEEVLGLGIVYKATVIKRLVDSMPIDS